MVFIKKKEKILLLILFSLLVTCSHKGSEESLAYISSIENLTTYQIPVVFDTLSLLENFNFNDSENLVGQVGSVVLDDRERVFFSDIQRKCIHVYDADGNYIIQLGREGKGPSEFISSPLLQVVGDELYALDISQRSLKIFSTNTLKFVSSSIVNPRNISKIPELEGAYQTDYKIRTDGNLLIGFAKRFQSLLEDSLVNNNGKPLVQYFLLNSEGEFISEKLAEISSPEILSLPQTDISFSSDYFPFFPQDRLSLTNKGELIIFNTSDLLLKKFSQNGEYIESYYYKIPKVSLTKDNATAIYPDQLDQHKLLRNIPIPKNWPVLAPALETVFTDDENRIWVATLSDITMQTIQWWVLTPKGQLIGILDLPFSTRIGAIGKGFLYSVNIESPHILTKYELVIPNK